MKKNRVLHIISSLNTGGAELFLYNLLKDLKNNKIHNEVLCLSGKGSLSRQYNMLSKKVIHLNFKNNFFNNLKNIFKFYKFSKNNEYDIVQGWMYHGNFFAFIFWLFSKKCLLFWNLRQTLYSIKNEKFFTKIIIYLNCWLSKFPDLIISNSETSIKQHINFGFNKKNFIFIPNGVDLSKFKKKIRKNKNKNINIAHIARFHPMKNHILALKIANKMIETNKNIKFFFVGKNINYDNSYLKDKINKNFLKKNIFLLDEKKKINKFLRNIDILISTSSWGEGFPNVVLEATVMGIPCVSTNIGDTNKILSKSLIINKNNDYRSFISTLHKVINKKINTNFKFVKKRYSLKKISKIYNNIYLRKI